MKSSDKNLAIIENFILHLTHYSDEREEGFFIPQTYTPEELYRVAYDYINEDHVDGKQNPDDGSQDKFIAFKTEEKESGVFMDDYFILEDESSAKEKFEKFKDEENTYIAGYAKVIESTD